MGVTLPILRDWMTRYVMSIFLVLGVLGNLINVYMFTRKDSLRSSCSFYLVAASAVNTLCVAWGIIPSLYILDRTDPSTYSFIYCKLRLYSIHTILMIGRSLIVCACIDRYALCSQSTRLRSFCAPKVAVRIILAHFCVWPLITLYITFIQEFVGNRCAMYGANSLIYAMYSTIVAGIVPPLLMAVLSIMTVRHRRELLARVNGTVVQTRRDNAFQMMLLCQVIVYVSTTALYPSMTLYRAVTDGVEKSTERQQIETFLSFLGGSFLIYLNPSSSFYIYFIATKTYRRDCKMVFLKLRRRICGKGSQVEPMVTQAHTMLDINQRTPSRF